MTVYQTHFPWQCTKSFSHDSVPNPFPMTIPNPFPWQCTKLFSHDSVPNHFPITVYQTPFPWQWPIRYDIQYIPFCTDNNTIILIWNSTSPLAIISNNIYLPWHSAAAFTYFPTTSNYTFNIRCEISLLLSSSSLKYSLISYINSTHYLLAVMPLLFWCWFLPSLWYTA